MSKDIDKAQSKTKGTRIMTLDKAIKLMDDYKRNNFNGYKTLMQNGYSENYALKQARNCLQSAREKIQNALNIQGDTKEVAQLTSDLYSVVGITREAVLKEYQSIINQNINLAVKLRALEPLIRQEGVKWDEKETQQAQSVSIVLKEVQPTIEATVIDTQ